MSLNELPFEISTVVSTPAPSLTVIGMPSSRRQKTLGCGFPLKFHFLL